MKKKLNIRKKNEIKILLIILFVAVLFRVPQVGLNFANDEDQMALGIESLAKLKTPYTVIYRCDTPEGFPEKIPLNCTGEERYEIIKEPPIEHLYYHPPLSFIMYTPLAFLPVSREVAFRSGVLIFSLITIILLYLLARQLYNRKVALFTAALAAVSSYHVLSLSYRLTKEVIVISVIMLCFWLWVRWNERVVAGKSQGYGSIWLIGFLIGAGMLMRMSMVLFLFYLIFYELVHKRFRGPIIMSVVSLGMVLAWYIYDYFATDLHWFKIAFVTTKRTTLGLASPLWDTSVHIGKMMVQLTAAHVAFLIIITLLSFFVFFKMACKVVQELKQGRWNGALDKVRVFIMRPEIMLLGWVILYYCAAAFTKGGGAHGTEKYMLSALPLSFILIADLMTRKTELKPALLAGSFGVYFVLLYYVNVHDALFYSYLMFRDNAATLIVWALPFVFVPLFFIKRIQRVVLQVLFGCLLAASVFFLIFPQNSFFVNNSLVSQEMEMVPLDKTIVTKSTYLVRTGLFYDWMGQSLGEKRRVWIEDEGWMDENVQDRTYDIIMPLSEWGGFADVEGCEAGMMLGDFPTYYVCSGKEAYS